MTEVSAGQYLAIPYSPFVGNLSRNETILEGCLNLPNLFPLPGSPTERRVIVASWLTDPNHIFWEVWRQGAVVGILGLSRIIRGLDALAHFAFFDRQLLGRRQLVLNTMGWCFRELDLQRLSVEIPDHLEPLIRFCRAKLGFRYEGELLAAAHPKLKEIAELRINGPERWLAHWGARRERMHYDGIHWHDLVCMRLLREEYERMS